MKKPSLMKKPLLFLVALLSVLSCSNDDQPQQAQIKMYKQDVSTEFKSAVKNLLTSSSAGRVAGDDITFDVDNMQAISTDGSTTLSLVANQVGFSLNNDVNYGLAFFAQDNSLVAGAVIKTSKNNDGTKNIEYFSLDGTLLIRSIVNDQQNTSNTIALSSSSGRVEGGVSGCGQRTMDCVDEAYTKSGWLSVGLTLVTIFDPMVGAGVVAGCGVACLVSPDQTTSILNNPNIRLTSATVNKTVIAIKPL
jgi:hypothetical protein